MDRGRVATVFIASMIREGILGVTEHCRAAIPGGDPGRERWQTGYLRRSNDVKIGTRDMCLLHRIATTHSPLSPLSAVRCPPPVMQASQSGVSQSSYHSTPLKSGSRSHQAGISLPSSQNRRSLEITHQEIINLGTHVLPTAIDAFMARLPGYTAIRATLADDDVTTVMAAFGLVPQGGLESLMYIPLVSIH